jgi:hypothetical protein
MKTFKLHRKVDVSGISGTGVVAFGCEFQNGFVLLHWSGEKPSIVFHQSLANVISVHCHNGATEIVFDEVESFNKLVDPFIGDSLAQAQHMLSEMITEAKQW